MRFLVYGLLKTDAFPFERMRPACGGIAAHEDGRFGLKEENLDPKAHSGKLMQGFIQFRTEFTALLIQSQSDAAGLFERGTLEKLDHLRHEKRGNAVCRKQPHVFKHMENGTFSGSGQADDEKNEALIPALRRFGSGLPRLCIHGML